MYRPTIYNTYWLQGLKSPEVSEFKDKMSNPYFRYVFYMILRWEFVYHDETKMNTLKPTYGHGKGYHAKTNMKIY